MKGHLTLDTAINIQAEAESLMVANEFDVRSMDVLQLASSSGCSAYDCEFVALAKTLNIPLVTADKKNISEFPDTAVTMEMVLAQDT